MEGEVLYPLNQLAAVKPALYELQKSKYAGREATLEFRIPGLDLLMGDALHCACVHPYRVFAARQAAGIDDANRDGPTWLTGTFFAIPVERILHHRVIWYSWKTLWINGAPGEDVPDQAPDDEFEPFISRRYREHPDVPRAHVEYLRRMKQRGQRPLTFVHIPHIFVAGPVDVTGLPPLSWDQPPPATPPKDI